MYPSIKRIHTIDGNLALCRQPEHLAQLSIKNRLFRPKMVMCTHISVRLVKVFLFLISRISQFYIMFRIKAFNNDERMSNTVKFSLY